MHILLHYTILLYGALYFSCLHHMTSHNAIPSLNILLYTPLHPLPYPKLHHTSPPFPLPRLTTLPSSTLPPLPQLPFTTPLHPPRPFTHREEYDFGLNHTSPHLTTLPFPSLHPQRGIWLRSKPRSVRSAAHQRSSKRHAWGDVKSRTRM